MRNDFESNYLMHHGILGQKWGKRNGPPYPLGASDHSAAEKKAGYEKSIKRKQDDKKVIDEKSAESKRHLTDEQKRMIKNGAIAAGVALAVVGGVYLYKKVNLNPTHIAMSRFGTILDPKDFSAEAKLITKANKIQRISSQPIEDYIKDGKRIYASYLKRDNAIYKELMPQYIKQWSRQGIINGDKTYVHSLKLKRDIKIASPRDVLEAYVKASGEDKIDHGKFSKFAVELIDKNSEVNNKFFAEIKARGFDGIIDPNDSDYITGRVFGKFTDSPLILVDPASIIESSKSNKLGRIGKFVNVITS